MHTGKLIFIKTNGAQLSRHPGESQRYVVNRRAG